MCHRLRLLKIMVSILRSDVLRGLWMVPRAPQGSSESPRGVLWGTGGFSGGPRGVLGGSLGPPWGFLERLGELSGGHWRSSWGPRGSSESAQGALGGPSEVLGGLRGTLGAVLGRPRALLGTSECGLKIIEKNVGFRCISSYLSDRGEARGVLEKSSSAKFHLWRAPRPIFSILADAFL